MKMYFHKILLCFLLIIVPGSIFAADEKVLCDSYSGSPGNELDSGLVWIKGGTFKMGSNYNQPEERFEHQISVQDFWIDRHEVTNRQFTQFVEATGYLTVAERHPKAEDYQGLPKELLVPGSVVFIPPTNFKNGSNVFQWWQYIPGANWMHPLGPGSDIDGLENHPVVHVAYEDALAYAKWRGRSLPTEAQWEYAALGGLQRSASQTNYVRGGQLQQNGHWMANTWQGIFPLKNSVADGYMGTSPVGCFPANGYGLFDMIGNVWELTVDSYTARHIVLNKALPKTTHLPARVIKGGSFLCSPNFCARYRPSARQPQEVDSGTSHVGFRTTLNIERK